MDKEEAIKKLTLEEYNITQEKGTEAPFKNAYWDFHGDGMYHCKVCNAALFASDRKFDSKSGWPSFDAPVKKDAVSYHEDIAHGMRRIEATCANCGAHLGHVFPDGPTDTTGQRFCINSASLNFEEKNK
jgi:peptide-methionine (R)-S-oxide reductase